MIDERIKPCPFCGCTVAAVYKAHDYESWHVSCMRCDVVTPEHDSEESAIEAWNTRKPMERIVERLEEEVEYQNTKADEADVFEKVSVSNTRLSMRNCYKHAIEIVKAGGADE